MAISRKRQYQLLTKNGVGTERNYKMVDELPLKDVNVVFQGVEGAYSYAAMRAYFPEEINSYHVKTFRAAMEEVAFGKADYAVLPIENSTEGIVTDIYDLLTEYQLYIVGEQGVRVQHVLLGLPGVTVDEIDTVYSHPQALAQCKHYLEEHPSWKTVKAENTAASAKRIKEEQKRNQAAIASRAAGELYGLSILAENICHNDQNVTRFIIVSSKPIYEKKLQERSAYASNCQHAKRYSVSHAVTFYLQQPEHDKDRVQTDPGNRTGKIPFLCRFRRKPGRSGGQKCTSRS